MSEDKQKGQVKAPERILNPEYVELGKAFEKRESIDDEGMKIPYRFFIPKMDKGKNYPLVIFLHGGGERGSDNESQLVGLIGGTIYSTPEHQAENPCFIYVPQCPEGYSFNEEWVEKLIINTIYEIIRTNPVDMTRIYITGLSMGAMGTWHYISKYTNLFAAAMPICGAGDPYAVRAAKNVPVWAFHAEDDSVVPVTGPKAFPGRKPLYGTRLMVNSLRSAGNGSVFYTEYPSGYMKEAFSTHPHCSWEPAYRDEEARKWMFAQSRTLQYEVNYVKPGVWHFEDYSGSSFYMIEGKYKALVIDTGMGKGDIMPLLSSITTLPLELAITHAHGDHMYHADKFDVIYMSPKEKEILPVFMRFMMEGKNLDESKFVDIAEDSIIDLGGGVVIEVTEVGGHTPGSVAFIDRKHNFIFTGDSVGSGAGVWMQVPGALSISEYKTSLEHFAGKLSGHKDIVFMGGHRNQEKGIAGSHQTYNPLTKQLVEDMIELCGKLLKDEVEAEEFTLRTFTEEKAFDAKHGTAEMIFLKSRVKM